MSGNVLEYFTLHTKSDLKSQFILLEMKNFKRIIMKLNIRCENITFSRLLWWGVYHDQHFLGRSPSALLGAF